MSNKIEVALFDFDKTLIPVSSGTFLIQSFLKLKLISWSYAIRLFFLQLGYRFGIVDIDAVMRETISIVDGVDREKLEQVLLDIYETKLKGMLHPEAKKAIAAHKAAGRKVVIVSNNLAALLKQTVKDWGVDDVIANEVCYDGDKVVGQYRKTICYGEGKIARLKDLPYFDQINFAKSYFYSDSYYDLPLLEFVGYPVAINADVKLARWAKVKNTEMHTWN